MKKSSCIFLACLLFISCVNNRNSEVKRTTSEYKVLNDEILTSIPGGLYLLNEHIAWFEPFTSGNFLHLLDMESGMEVSSFGTIGQGPNEFVSPMVSNNIWNNCLYVYDVNGNSKGYFSVDKHNETGDAFVQSSKEDSLIRLKGYTMRLDDNLYFGYNRDHEDKAYKLYDNGIETIFGEYILPNKKQIFSSYIAYNPHKELLVTGALGVNYFSC